MSLHCLAVSLPWARQGLGVDVERWTGELLILLRTHTSFCGKKGRLVLIGVGIVVVEVVAVVVVVVVVVVVRTWREGCCWFWWWLCWF